MKTWDAIVIGAGCAGLSAASKLSEEGQSVLVLEKRPLLGGRTSSFVDAPSGEELDNGQHLMLGCYIETQKYIDRIGSQEDLHFFDRFETLMAGPKDERAKLKASKLPAPFHLAVGLMKYRALSFKERLRTIQVARAAKKNGVGLSSISVTDWLTHLNQSKSSREKLWNLITLATLNIHPDRAPANLFRVVMKEGFLKSSKGSRVALSKVGLSQLFGSPAKEFIEKKGGEVRMKTGVKSISRNNAHWEVHLNDGGVETAKEIVLAVPPTALEKLSEESPILLPLVENSKRLKSSPILSLHIWLKKPWPLSNAFIGFWGMQFHWLFQKSKFSKHSPKHLSLVISAAQEVFNYSKEDLKGLAEKELSMVAKEKVEIERIVMVKEPEATWVPPLGDNSCRLATVTEIPHLYLAGDWTDTGLPCTIESAVVSGHKAAEAVLLTP